MVFNVPKTGLALALICMIVPGSAESQTHHYSYSSDEAGPYVQVIGRSATALPEAVCPEGGEDIRAGIVTHHFLARTLMADFFSCLAAKTGPDRVVLIGPDHYGQAIAGIAFSPLPWVTPFGELSSDPLSVAALREALEVLYDVNAFSGEHSISVLVPFVRYYFPNSRIVPIIVQRNVRFDLQVRLKQVIENYLADPRTLVLLSMDFSHDQSPAEAGRRDRRAKSVIETLDYLQTDTLDIDCHPGSKLLLCGAQCKEGCAGPFSGSC